MAEPPDAETTVGVARRFRFADVTCAKPDVRILFLAVTSVHGAHGNVGSGIVPCEYITQESRAPAWSRQRLLKLYLGAICICWVGVY